MADTLAVERIGLQQGEFSGRVAVVTGAGRGIGREIARAFAWLGARVALAEISPQTGQETERLIREAGGEARCFPTDISDPDQVQALARQVRQAYGPTDFLVNNAILSPAVSVVEMDVALWDRVMAVNLRGAFLACKAFLPDMLERKRGVILNMTSAEAMPYLSAYIASKQGLAAFSQSLAGEVGESGVRVIAFGPGFVDTPGLRESGEGLAPHMGLTAEQFVRLPFHAAYPQGAMPAGHAAAAAAYLAARLADEYHGEQVTGYTILERAGFISSSSPSSAISKPAPKEPSLAGSGDREDVLRRALGYSGALQAAIAESEQELGRLPIFVRPMARQGFKGKAGLSLADWARTAAGLNARLQQVIDGNPDTVAVLRQELPRLGELLSRLEVYYREAPGEMARFTKDVAAIREAEEIARRRTGVIHGLVETLEKL